MGKRQRRRMAEKDTRFYVVNAGVAALLVNGIRLISMKKPREEEKDDDKAGCPFAMVSGEHTAAGLTGTLAVTAAVCMIDRVNMAGAMGLVAAVLPFCHKTL